MARPFNCLITAEHGVDRTVDGYVDRARGRQKEHCSHGALELVLFSPVPSQSSFCFASVSTKQRLQGESDIRHRA